MDYFNIKMTYVLLKKMMKNLRYFLKKIVVFELYSYALLCANNYLFHTHPHVFIRGKPQLLISK